MTGPGSGVYLNIHIAEGDPGGCHLVLETIEPAQATYRCVIDIQVRAIPTTPHQSFSLGGDQLAMLAKGDTVGTDVQKRAVQGTTLDLLHAQDYGALVARRRFIDRLQQGAVDSD